MPSDIKSISVKDAKGFVTNIDTVDADDSFCIRTRGARTTSKGYLLQRDFGTKHRYDSYPVTRKDKHGFITNVTKEANHDIVVTCAGHGETTGNTITIFGTLGSTEINGEWTITVIDDNSFSLDGTSATTITTYSSGGWFLKTNPYSRIVAAFTLIDTSTNLEHDIVIVRSITD